jgi:hypothetical protein
MTKQEQHEKLRTARLSISFGYYVDAWLQVGEVMEALEREINEEKENNK